MVPPWLALGRILARGGGGGWHRLGRAWGADTQWGVPDHRALLSEHGKQQPLFHARGREPGPWARVPLGWGLWSLFWGRVRMKETWSSEKSWWG